MTTAHWGNDRHALYWADIREQVTPRLVETVSAVSGLATVADVMRWFTERGADFGTATYHAEGEV